MCPNTHEHQTPDLPQPRSVKPLAAVLISLNVPLSVFSNVFTALSASVPKLARRCRRHEIFPISPINYLFSWLIMSNFEQRPAEEFYLFNAFIKYPICCALNVLFIGNINSAFRCSSSPPIDSANSSTISVNASM